MNWQKYGLIFAPQGQMQWLVSHAAVPTALCIGGDRYRIYFSGRDHFNRSQTGYFDIDLTIPTEILIQSPEPCLQYGQPGTFDDSGAMSAWIIKSADQMYLYYIGWNTGTTVPFRNSIGLALSRDGGQTFQKHSRGPILDRTTDDPFFVASPCVLIENSLWRMWYLSCIGWEPQLDGTLRHSYLIKYAESNDGIHWDRTGLTCIGFKSKDEYAISRPCVLNTNGTYKMWYSHRGQAYRIGYAESSDGIHWERKDEEVGIDVSENGWDSEMIEYPFVFTHGSSTYMLYNGNSYGKTGIGLALLQ